MLFSLGGTIFCKPAPLIRRARARRRTTSHATAKSEKQRPRAPSRPRRQASINNIGCDWPPAQAAAIAGAKQATPSVTFGSVSQSSAPVGRNAPRNKRSPSALRCSQRALAGCRSTFNIHALLFNAARQCCGARYAAVLPALFPPPFTSAFGSPPLRPAPARLALPVRKQPSRPRQCERTAQTHEQFPCEYEPLRESRPSLEYTTRQAAACRFRPRREHLPLISTTALGLSAATHSLSLLQSLGSPPTPLSL